MRRRLAGSVLRRESGDAVAAAPQRVAGSGRRCVRKGHWYLEIFISGVETLLFDILIGLIGWRYVLKPYIAQRQAQAIAQDHALHGIEAHANDRDQAVPDSPRVG